ncbi:MAG: ORF6N domain-containing protein [Bacteroidales bacterium]|nr:ORF6N domain-containing protein [Bacteroidales bacterium]
MSKEIDIAQKFIENKIFTIRGLQVMLDRDLAEIYTITTGRLNEQVKRNADRFPDDFMFQLTEKDWEILKSQNAISSEHGGRRKLPYVFTEQGVASLSGVLKSETAAKVHVAIMRAFVEMRKLIANHSGLLQRIEGIERKQIESDLKFEQIFKALESKNTIPTQGVFFNGQVFDAYELASKIIRSAKQSIVLIDNYIDESTLTHLSKKEKTATVLLLTKNIDKQLLLDVKKANEQYGSFQAKPFTQSHDRFLIIDNNEIYHLGASLKDLGKKWFAFSKLDKSSVTSILNSISEIA